VDHSEWELKLLDRNECNILHLFTSKNCKGTLLKEECVQELDTHSHQEPRVLEWKWVHYATPIPLQRSWIFMQPERLNLL
jgi:hypothetical protein